MTEVLETHTTDTDEAEVERQAPSGSSGLARFIDEVAEFVHAIEAKLQEGISDKVELPLSNVLREAAKTSQNALETFRMNTSDSDSLPDAWQDMVDYRSTVEKGVVSAVSRYLRDGQPGAALSEEFQNSFAALIQRAETVEEFMETDAAGSALEARPGDPMLLRARKAVHRKFHRPKPVPLRALANYHLQVRLSRALSRKREAAQRQLATCLVCLETATSTWTHAILDQEKGLDKFGRLLEDDRENRKPSAVAENGEDQAGEPAAPRPFSEIRSEILANGEKLSGSLEKAAKLLGGLYPPFDKEELANLHESLDYDAKAIGTFLVKPNDRELPKSVWLPAALAVKADAIWLEYQEESRNRIRLNQHLLRIRAALIRVLSQILNQVYAATVIPLRDIYEDLSEEVSREASTVKTLFEGGIDAMSRQERADTLHEVAARASKTLDEINDNLNGVNVADAALRNLGSGEWERTKRAVDQLPSRSEIHAIDVDGEPFPRLHAPRSSINLKQIANEVLGIRFAEQLKKPAKQLRRVVAKRWGDVLMVVDSVAFNARASAEKLLDDDAPETYEEAKKVALDGLNRSLERTRDAPKALDAPWAEFNEAVTDVLMNVWKLVHRRVKSAELEADQWADIGSRISIASQSYRLRLTTLAHTVKEKLHIWFRLGKLKASVLIRKGQSAVGVSTSSAADITATIDAIRSFEEVDEEMPFIYRRLFSLDALENPSFLEGRSTDVQAVRTHFDRWKQGKRPPVLVVSSRLGSGRTSFMNTLQNLVFDDVHVFSVHFKDRLREEGEVVDVLSNALELSIDSSDFASLSAAIGRKFRRDKPVVCQLYELEHLIISAPGGSELISRLLVFLSATDEHIYWLGGVSELCRQFMERTSLTSGLVAFHDLSPLSQGEFEALILNRNRRTGIEVVFKPPENMSPLMRQRLNRAESDDDRQEILKETFFDQLSRFAEQDLRLALFSWLKSADFDEKGDTALMTWRLALDFSFLSAFDRQHAFSLRSFLFHKTMTVEEHSEIFRMSINESVLILESLLNTGLLSAADDEGPEPLEVKPGIRYRIHPLMQGPVRQQLVGRHMVY